MRGKYPLKCPACGVKNQPQIIAPCHRVIANILLFCGFRKKDFSESTSLSVPLPWHLLNKLLLDECVRGDGVKRFCPDAEQDV